MTTIVFEFLDTTRGQSGPFGLAALGMPDCWMDALIGDGYSSIGTTLHRAFSDASLPASPPGTIATSSHAVSVR